MRRGASVLEDMKEDRRIRRTKKLIGQALSELMNEKDIKNITVKDIADRADVNRGTFYLHYKDVYDLLSQIEDDMIRIFTETIDRHHITAKDKTTFPIIDQMLDYVFENMELCKALFLSSSGGVFQEKFQNVIIQKGFEIQKCLSGRGSTKHNEYIFCFMATGITGIVKKWFSDSEAMSKKDISIMLDALIKNLSDLLN